MSRADFQPPSQKLGLVVGYFKAREVLLVNVYSVTGIEFAQSQWVKGIFFTYTLQISGFDLCFMLQR